MANIRNTHNAEKRFVVGSQPSCDERIGAHLASRLEDFAQRREDAEGNWNEEYVEPLAIEVKRSVRILLSTGGPGDWLDVELDDDLEIGGISYHFNDWFDHAERELHGDELAAATQYAEEMGVPGALELS